MLRLGRFIDVFKNQSRSVFDLSHQSRSVVELSHIKWARDAATDSEIAYQATSVHSDAVISRLLLERL